VDHDAYRSSKTGGVQRPRSASVLLRHASLSNALGLLAIGCVASLTTAGLLVDSNRSRSLVLAFLAVALVLAVVVAATVVWAVRSRAGGSLAGEFVSAWERPMSGWLFFFVGCVLALPIVSFYSRVLVGDPDSERLLASILHVQRQGVGYLIDSQEVLLPHVLLGPIVSLGGIPALQAFNVLSVIALAGVIAFLSWRLTGSRIGAVSATLALTALGPVLERAYFAPMYPAMLTFGFLGLYLAYRVMTGGEPARPWLAAVLAAIAFIGSMEAHQVGQLFVLLSGLLLVAVPSLRAAAGLGRVYFCLAVLYIPRALINLSDGGLSYFFQNRVDYWVTKGYLLSIQVEMFDYPRELSLGEYLRELPAGLLDAWGASGWLTLVLGAAAIVVAGARLRRFVLTSAFLLLAIVIYFRLPFFPRYLSLLLVGSALAAGVTIAALSGRRTFWRRAAVGVALAGLVAANVANYHTELDHFQKLTRKVLQGPGSAYRQLARQVGPGEGVIGTRSLYLYSTSTNPSTYGDQFLSESEYRTFLTWPSDADVIAIMHRHHVQWVFVPRQQQRWVVRYNDIWLRPAYDQEARYPRKVRRSPNFCLAKRAHGAFLYRLEPGVRGPSDKGPFRCVSTAAG
jgi:hypothetical protein